MRAEATIGSVPLRSRRMELTVWLIVLAMGNAPLLTGGSTATLALLPDAVLAGDWWRVLTHPFVHVSWYHLLLDGAAFLLLWKELGGSLRSRLACGAASAGGSLLAAALVSPEFWSLGLCGLSGIAHGLMAQQGLERWLDRRSPRDRTLGRAIFFAVSAKSLLEALTGSAFLAWLHFGLLGTPIAVCHLGGVCGAILAGAVNRLARKEPRPHARMRVARCATLVTLHRR